MTLGTNIQTTVAAILTQFGSSVTVTRYNNVYNTDTGGPTGNATGILTDGSTYATAETDITLQAAGTGEIKAGDTITFSSHATEYEIATGLTDVSAGGVITITPGLTQQVDTAETITIADASTTSTYTATILTDTYNVMERTLSSLSAASNDTLIKGTDKKIFMSQSDTYTPESGDYVEYRSQTYRIADVKVYDLQAATYIYELRLEI